MDEPRFVVEVRESPTEGLGLFARDFIPRGAVWWQGTEANVLLIGRAQYGTLGASHLPGDLKAFLDAVHTYTYYERDLDALVFILDDTRFINHSFTPNSGGGDLLRSRALRDIEPGEEILEDYTAYDRCPWASLYGAFGEVLKAAQEANGHGLVHRR
jgi:hypothetical protein